MTEDPPGPPHTDEPRLPPPAAGPTNDPPPFTAFAWRNGLVRPTQGRLLAGVCGALGRATKTDPILWRVVLAVLALFGGIGVLAYLLGWLLLPAEGDTASPVEALAGHGMSGTSTALTIVGVIVVLFAVAAIFSEPLRPGLLGAALLGGALLLLLRDHHGRARNTAGPGAAAAPVWSSPGGVGVTETTPHTPAPVPPAPPYAPPAPPYAPQPPFAPRGPFVPGSLPPPPPAPPPYAPPTVKPPPPPKPPRSRLGRLTLSVVLLVLGLLTILDVMGRHVPASGYVAAALATVGVGLLVGAWFGRARALIPLGIVLAVALASITATDRVRGSWSDATTTWAPSSISQVEDTYRQEFGDLRIDFSKVDFSSSTVTVDVKVDVGNLEIVLPPNVDAVIDADVDVGKAMILSEAWSGLGLDKRTVTNYGDDGPGGGQLRINAVVDLGNMEVHR